MAPASKYPNETAEEKIIRMREQARIRQQRFRDKHKEVLNARRRVGTKPTTAPCPVCSSENDTPKETPKETPEDTPKETPCLECVPLKENTPIKRPIYVPSKKPVKSVTLEQAIEFIDTLPDAKATINQYKNQTRNLQKYFPQETNLVKIIKNYHAVFAKMDVDTRLASTQLMICQAVYILSTKYPLDVSKGSSQDL